MPQTSHNQVKKAAMQHKLHRLQRLVARFQPEIEAGAAITTGFDPIDAYLTQQGGGGLPCGGLHEVVAARAGDMAAALGFAYRLTGKFLAQAVDTTTVLYGQTHAAVREGGQPYAPALAAHDLSGAHLAYLDGVTLPDLLWAGEEALACPAIGCSLLASWDTPPDFTASRRLTLAARAAGRPLLMVLGAPAAGMASAATTRWQVESLPQQGWRITLVKSRLAYEVVPPVQGWRVYPQRMAVPMEVIAPETTVETADMIAPLMAAQARS